MTFDMNKSCCFTGHRPTKLNADEKDIRAKLAEEIRKAADEGIDTFITGMATGVDTWAAEEVLKLKKEKCNIQLVCAVPFKGVERKRTQEEKELFYSILKEASHVEYICPGFTKWCFYDRNRWMVDRAGRLIAVFNGTHGGTEYTINYAKENGREIVMIKDSPDEYDELFGVPKIEVWNTIDLLDFSDAVTAYTTGESFNKRKYLKQKSFAVVEGLNNKYRLKIKTVIVGKSFEESVKLSSQKQRPDVIREIKKAIIELAAVECEEGTRYRELTLKEGKCRLLYRYIGDAKLIAEIDKDELCELLDMNNAPGPEPADAGTNI